MTIRIVTDSTCDIPAEIAAANRITIVPAYINIGNRSYLDGVELSRQDFYKGLPDYTSPPTTAAPAPGAFTETYNRLGAEGVTEILSIHVASSLSGMLNAARLGAEAANGVAVTLFDSQQLTMGLGLLAITAAEGAAAGCSMEEIEALLKERVSRTFVFGLLDTLEYVRRSGRVSWAQFGLGTLLQIKPLLRVHEGNVEMLARVRTSKRALQRMMELVTQLGPLEKIALLHIQGTDRIEAFRQQTKRLFPQDNGALTVELTPALGAHIGPGGLGVACIAAMD